MKFQKESLHQIWEEAQELTRAHQAEVGVLGVEDFELDKDRYLQMEDLNVLRAYTAREGGELVGYAVFFITPHHHYARSLWATQDCIYFKPEHRGVNAYEFIEFTDEELRREGVEVVGRGVTKHKDYSGLLKNIGYEAIETNYVRKLNG